MIKLKQTPDRGCEYSPLRSSQEQWYVQLDTEHPVDFTYKPLDGSVSLLEADIRHGYHQLIGNFKIGREGMAVSGHICAYVSIPKDQAKVIFGIRPKRQPLHPSGDPGDHFGEFRLFLLKPGETAPAEDYLCRFIDDRTPALLIYPSPLHK